MGRSGRTPAGIRIRRAEAAERPPNQIVRDRIGEFVRRQRDARDHAAWFRAEVAQVLREADDPTVKRIPNDEIEASWERKRAEHVRRLGGVGLRVEWKGAL